MSKSKENFKEKIMRSMPSMSGNSQFDRTYNQMNEVFDKEQVVPLTVFTVCMAFVEMTLVRAKKVADEMDIDAAEVGMEYLTDLLHKTADAYSPKKESCDINAIDLISKTFDVSPHDAKEWLKSDTGSFQTIGHDSNPVWVSGRCIATILSKAGIKA